jgi:hypothetical protein
MAHFCIAAMGTASGIIKILTSHDLMDFANVTTNPASPVTASFKVSNFAIERFEFSEDSHYAAACSSDSVVSLFRLAVRDQKGGAEWQFLGSYGSHYKPIVGLLFGTSEDLDSVPKLLSIGEDQNVVEYDLANSSIVNGIRIKVGNSCRHCLETKVADPWPFFVLQHCLDHFVNRADGHSDGRHLAK